MLSGWFYALCWFAVIFWLMVWLVVGCLVMFLVRRIDGFGGLVECDFVCGWLVFDFGVVWFGRAGGLRVGGLVCLLRMILVVWIDGGFLFGFWGACVLCFCGFWFVVCIVLEVGVLLL